jgi:hypothetical protein
LLNALKLPNPDRAIVDIAKLRSYSLDLEHTRGGPKARVFRAALGLTVADAEWLRDRLLEVVALEATEAGVTEFGSRYVIDFTLQASGREARVRSSWIILKEEDFPRLTTCYVKRNR